MRNFTLAVLLLLVSGAGMADSRTAKVRELMEAQGLLGMFQQQMEQGRAQGQQQAQQTIDQLLAAFDLPPEFEDRLRDAHDEFIAALAPTWTAQDIVDKWAELYGAQFTDTEIDALVDFYTSPLGQKESSVSQQTLPAFTEYFANLSAPIMQNATEQFIQNLKRITTECNCRRE